MESKYKIIVSWSKQDGAYIAEAPELPGCVADGQTRQETVVNIERIIQEWIETARKLGRSVPDYLEDEKRERQSKPGIAIGKLRVINDDDAHLEDFREYMP